MSIKKYYYSSNTHPKRKICEDVILVCEKYSIFGVADGVGGFRKKGIQPGNFPREFIRNCKKGINKKSIIDLSKLIDFAYSETTKEGGTTLCLVRVHNYLLFSLNIGDSATTIIRDNSIVFSSMKTLNGYNFPFQLSKRKGMMIGNNPRDAVNQKFRLKPNDIILLASDGLYDNLFDSEIIELLSLNGDKATNIVSKAYDYSLDKNRNSPFALNSKGRYPVGGKKDDISAIVVIIE